MIVSWTALKNLLVTRGIGVHGTQDAENYFILAIDGTLSFECVLQKRNINEDLLDFETNYKPTWNLPLIQQKDSDGAVLSRTKAAPTGWTYQLRSFEFTTADLSTIVNKDAITYADQTDVTMKLYDADDVEITDNANKANAVKTVVDYEPSFDHYIMGGCMRILDVPTNDVRFSVIAVPDVPAIYGGSKIMIQNINFKYVQEIKADGRAAKFLQYSATSHTNKLRFVLRHPAGESHGLAVYLEHFKA